MRLSIAPIAVALLLTTCCSAASNRQNLRLSIEEESSPGTVVADMVSIFGLRWEERAGREFKLLNQQFKSSDPLRHHGIVTVDPDSGIIKLRRKVDRDLECGSADECVLVVQAVMLPQRVFSFLQLEVVINDVNDNAPTFPTNPISVNISESAAVGDVINLDQYQARDVDTGNNSRITYSISSNEHFDVRQSIDEAGRPHLQLELLKKLDYETKKVYHVTVTAIDHGSPSRSNHVPVRIRLLDTNDNRPIFEKYEYVASLRENLTPGTVIETIQAEDLDSGDNGQITYFIVDESDTSISTSLLSIDATTGAVSLLEELDRELHDGLKVEIEARDGGTPELTSRTWLILQIEDVNDNSPNIKSNFIFKSRHNTAYVMETTPIGAYIAYVSASDKDHGRNGDVTITIRTETRDEQGRDVFDSGHFVLANDGLIGTGKEFNREKQNRYKIVVSACDDGTPNRCSFVNISVEILDENDNSPVFVQPIYSVTMSEGSEVGSYVTTVVANDNDAINKPVMTKNENEQIVPSNNGDVRYSIKDNQNTFSIDEETGRITLVRPLDREGRSDWEITVTAEDGGKPSRSGSCLLKVHVDDVNDNRPLFINPTLDNSTIYASILRSEVITRIQTLDYDSEKYSRVRLKLLNVDTASKDQIIDGVEPYSFFLLDPKSGDLQLNMSRPNPEEVIGEHRIVVEASDNGKPSLSSKMGIIIYVSDSLLPPTLVYKNKGELASSSQGLSSSTLIIVISLASFLLLLVVMISVVVIKCKNDNKKVRTYNCRQAETENGCRVKSSETRSSKHDDVPTVWDHRGNDVASQVTNNDQASNETNSTTASQSTTLRTTSVSGLTNMNASQSECKFAPPRDVATLYHVLTSIERPTTPLNTFACDGRITQSKMLDLAPKLSSSQTDRDSGKGDSEADSTSVSGSNDKDYEKLHKYSYNDFQESKSSNYDTVDIYNTMGSYCTEECRQYGHSDSCWMPTNDNLQLAASQPSTGCQYDYSPVLETIKESSPSKEMSTADIDYEPVAMRERVRRSICLSVLATESRIQQPYTDQRIQHSDELSRQYQLWADEYDTATSVFTSHSSSPAPSSDACPSMVSSSKVSSSVFPSHNFDNRDSYLHKNIIVHNEDYLSVTTEATKLCHEFENNSPSHETDEMLSDIDKLL